MGYTDITFYNMPIDPFAHSAHYHIPIHHTVVCAAGQVQVLFAHKIFRQAPYRGQFPIQLLTHSEGCMSFLWSTGKRTQTND